MLAFQRLRPSQRRSFAGARLRHRARRLAIKTVLVGASAATVLFLTLPAVAAADTEYSFAGHSVHTGECQADVKVHFNATLHKSAHWKHVSQFKVTNLNFPRSTPPIPFGKPRGECLPGEHAFVFENYRVGFQATMPFDDDHPSEFNGRSHNPPDVPLSDAYEAWVVGGKVSIRRHHHHFRVRARGDLGFAVSEGGLRYFGSSSGQVQWVATGHRE